MRRRNLIDKSDMCVDRGLQALGDDVVSYSGDYAALLTKALDRFGASSPSDWQSAAVPAKKSARSRQKSGLGPKDGVKIAIEPSGEVEVVTGGASSVRGSRRTAQICANALGADYRRIRVIHGQTRIPHGVGAHATRATVLTGHSCRGAQASHACAHCRG